jgi:hypothetical protein
LGANRCILRFSVINSLTTTSWTAPYLEWQLKTWETDTSPKIPLRYSRIESVWRTYGFQKTLQIRVPQDTVSEAFDFAVFQ